MHKFGLACFSAALLLGLACGDTTASSTGDCPAGSAGCPCTPGGGCDAELTCLSNACVALPGSTSTSTPTTGMTGTTGTPTGDDGTASAAQTATGAPTTGPVTSSTDDGGTTMDGPKLDVGAGETTMGTATEGCKKIDMLFVLDGSGSMTEERNALASVSAFTDIVTTLSNLNGQIDYRIAVTTDNDDGYVTPGSCWDQPDKWIDSAGNTPADVAKAFNCAVSGFGDSNFEAPVGCEHVLTSAIDLLDGDPSGFVRADALLVLVLVTDVDDYGAYDQLGGNDCNAGCATTPTPLPQLHERLLAVKNGDAAGVAAIVVAGDPTVDAGVNFCNQPGSCGCSLIDCGAFHAARLYEFTTLLTNGFAGDICGGASAVPMTVKTALTDKIDLACMQFDPQQ